MAAWKGIEEICKGSCTVLGLGISNLAAIEYLLSHGIRVTARDRKDREALEGKAEALEKRGVKVFLGEGYLEDLREDVILRSPGMRPDLPELREAVSRGALLTSETELFLSLTRALVLGITGSDGKTTTTTLTGLMLEKECEKRGKGRVFVGGNIGRPLLPLVDEMTEEDYAVLELSSFQLQTMSQSVPRAALTNVTPNHLNWHTDMEEYTRAKTNLFSRGENELLVTNAENEISARLAKEREGRVILFSGKRNDPCLLIGKPGDGALYLKEGRICYFDEEAEKEILDTASILLPGMHNVENYMTAIGLTLGLVSNESIREVATTFKGVAHRLERVATLRGVTYYNSSIDSSPTRTAAALSALAPAKPIVICGGYDKKTPFEPLAAALCEHAKAVVLTGATASAIQASLNACERVQKGLLPVCTDPNFRSAVLVASTLAKEGDIVLLSPACASFDAFCNFEERGRTFCDIVRELGEQTENG